MTRHAFAILAHDQWELAEILTRSLRHPDVRIFLHLNADNASAVVKEHPALATATMVARTEVAWGTFTLLDAQLSLLAAAVAEETDYVHLLSGKDLLLKPISQLIEFFDDHAGAEFVRVKSVADTASVQDRVSHFHVDTLVGGKNVDGPLGLGMRAAQKASLAAQRVAGVDRTKAWGRPVRSGSPWFSVTSEMARYFVDHASWARQHLRRTFVPEEFFYPTMVMHSPMHQNVYAGSRGQAANLRHIRWDPGQRGHPHVWTGQDIDQLTTSSNLFARKFDMITAPEAVAAVAAMSSPQGPSSQNPTGAQ
ncbi:MAG: beta-1,6-N-acetylglucosaminyltransferase [Ornithinimicrobium sp.]